MLVNYMASSSSINSSLAEQKIFQLPLTRAKRVPTPIILLKMCQNLQEVRQLHAQLVVSGLINQPLNPGRLIESYVSVCQIYHALSVFKTIPSPDVFAYNTIIRGLTQAKWPKDSILLYKKLLFGGLVAPDTYTFTFVLKACSHLEALFEGKQVHGQIIKAGIKLNTHIHSSLIHMYAITDCMLSAERVLNELSEENVLAKNSMISGYLSKGHVEIARQMFDKMPIKDAASWSAMITGYTKLGMDTKALVIFQEMIASKVPLNESTLVSALSACAHLGALDQGKWIHRYIGKNELRISITLGTCLVDMYAKCGCIENSYQVFLKMPHRDVVSWGVIIAGFALHGQATKCFKLFDEMVANNVIPNEVIFVAILGACSHAGSVEMGCHYFHQMVQFYGIRPSVEHYGCMVDLFGRAGLLEEAENVVVSLMSDEPNAVIWGALLGACRKHRDFERGKRAFEQLIKLEPNSGDRYKLAGKLFADAGEAEAAKEMRKVIGDKNLETTCGFSLIEVDGQLHKFEVGYIDHTRSREIYEMMEGG